MSIRNGGAPVGAAGTPTVTFEVMVMSKVLLWLESASEVALMTTALDGVATAGAVNTPAAVILPQGLGLPVVAVSVQAPRLQVTPRPLGSVAVAVNL